MKMRYISLLVVFLLLLTVCSACDYNGTKEPETSLPLESVNDTTAWGDVDYSKFIFSTNDYDFIEKYGFDDKTVENEEEFDEVIQYMMSVFTSFNFFVTTHSENALDKITKIDNVTEVVHLSDTYVLFSVSNSNIDIEVVKELARDPEIKRIKISVMLITDD